MRCFDLFASPGADDAYRRFGWDGVCIVGEYGGGFRRFAEDALKGGERHLIGALLASDVDKNAKKALDAADLVLVDGRMEDACREASESWDVDLIVNPELNAERDHVKQWAGGLDHIMCAFMAERNIGYLVNFGNILHSSGGARTRLFGRVMQNIRLAGKYDVRVVFTCGARCAADIRNPHELMNFGRLLGLPESRARDAVCRNPEHFIGKARDRASPDVILRGLTVKSWGRQERRPKRRCGWY